MDSDGGFLSIGCLERRLGRELCIVDVPAAATARAAHQPAENQEHAEPEGAQAGQIVLHLPQFAAPFDKS